MADLDTIRRLEVELTDRLAGKLVVNPDLSRWLVSFQGNKSQNGYRWFKYKEGFSAALINYLLDRLHIDTGRFIDPFAGSGAALIGTAKRGMNALGIELLPVGCRIIGTRQVADSPAAPGLVEALGRWLPDKPWRGPQTPAPFQHLRITAGAFPPETESALGKYVAAAEAEPEPARTMLRFTALCILEEISYTRKDGQYLRW